MPCGFSVLANTMESVHFSIVIIFFLIFFALVGVVMKKLFNIHSSLLTSIFGGLGIKGELLLLLHFLHL